LRSQMFLPASKQRKPKVILERRTDHSRISGGIFLA
jgi:hypothetical protein